MVKNTPWSRESYDILAHHTRWNQSEVEKIMPEDTIYVTMLRHPVDLFESLWSYSKLSAAYGMTLEEFAFANKSSEKFRKRVRGQLGQNQMHWDFGVPQNQIENVEVTKGLIREIEANFDLVMIAERFDESMVMLKNLLCWGTPDVASFKVNARNESLKVGLSNDVRTKLQEWNNGDQVLYSYFYEKFDKEVKEFGASRMSEELDDLHSQNEAIKKECLVSEEKGKDLEGAIRPYGPVIGFKVNSANRTCLDYARTELSFLEVIKSSQKTKTAQ